MNAPENSEPKADQLEEEADEDADGGTDDEDWVSRPKTHYRP